MDLCDQFCWTSLHHAAQAGKVEILELLLEAGANIDAQTITGTTPLMVAIQSTHLSCVEFFFTAGANVLMENKKGTTRTAESVIIDRVVFISILLHI